MDGDARGEFAGLVAAQVGSAKIAPDRALRATAPAAAASSGSRPRSAISRPISAVEQAGVEIGQADSARRGAAASVPLPAAAGPSMAMIMGARDLPAARISLGEVGAEAGHQRPEIREAGGDRRGVVDGDRRLRRRGRGRGSSWRCDDRDWVATVPPPGDLCRAGHRAANSGRLLDGDAVGREAGGDGGDAVGFLDPQSRRCPPSASRPSAKAAATASTGYSSIIEGARPAGTATPLSRLALTRTSPTSSPPTVRRFVDRDVAAHLESASRSGRCASG